MTRHKIQNLASLEREMRAVARGEKAAPADAAKPSYNSAAALIRLLTPKTRRLLAIIRDRKPRSIAELEIMAGRAQPNISRTLAKLEAAGFITMEKAAGRRKAPIPAVKKVIVEIDPFSDRDHLEMA